MAAFDERLADPIEALRGAEAQLRDASHTLSSYLDRTELDPERLRAVDERMSAWVGLARRYRRPPAELGALRRNGRTSCAPSTPPPISTALRAASDAARAAYDLAAKRISTARRAAAPKLAAAVTRSMQQLGMAGGRFEVALEATDAPQSFGLESAEFLVAGHAGTTPRPLGKVASGGELSRIALSVAVVTSELDTGGEAPSTLIFDEVDAGIGGAVAETVGRLMKQLGRDRQVLAVTHLPQVAACADRHFVVSKQTGTGQARSAVDAVAGESRVAEIARMLGGEKLSSTSLAHAQEMLSSSAVSPPDPVERRRDERARRARPLPLGGRGAKRGGSSPDWLRQAGAGDADRRHEIVLVTGISGSGKSVALHALEDAGFYCVDNLPPELLRDFLRLEQQQRDRRVAIAVDVRSAASLPHLLPLLAQLKDEGVAVHPIFLDATTAALVRRFSETRRAHPLADRGALVEAIDLERELLAGLREVSTVLDTSQLRPTQLRSWMRELVRRPRQPADAGVRELRLSPGRAARRRLRVRRPGRAESALRAGAAAADRARRAGRRVPGGAARRGGNARAHRRLPASLAAGVQGRPARLPHGGDRLHRRPAPLGLVRRAAGASASPRKRRR